MRKDSLMAMEREAGNEPYILCKQARLCGDSRRGGETMMSEKDYAVIEEAVMSTARGRWFLAEYARRIRAAETDRILMALAAVAARMETPSPAKAPALAATPQDPFAIALADIDAMPLTERLKLTA